MSCRIALYKNWRHGAMGSTSCACPESARPRAHFDTAIVSKLTVGIPSPVGVKFNFSNPMTRPFRSFIKMTSSSVSSQICSWSGSPNHTVSVFPSGSKNTFTFVPYVASFFDSSCPIAGNLKTLSVQTSNYSHHPSYLNWTMK